MSSYCLHISDASHLALPPNQLPQYHLAGFDGAGCLISYTTLKPLKPGEMQKIFLADAQSQLARIAIQRPNGAESISYFI